MVGIEILFHQELQAGVKRSGEWVWHPVSGMCG